MVTPSPREEFAQLISRLSDIMNARLSAADAPLVEQVLQFARYVYANAPVEELAKKRIDDFYGMTLAMWDFLHLRPLTAPRIRVFNPRFEDHGWQTTHTIVEVVSTDRAFLVDSIAMELNRRGLTIHSVVAESLFCERDSSGRLQHIHLVHEGAAGEKEAFIHVEIDRQSDEAVLADIVESLGAILSELDCAVNDFPAMMNKTHALADMFAQRAKGEIVSVQEIKAFLHWLTDNHFTFLAIREYQAVEQGGWLFMEAQPEHDLGIVKTTAHIDLMELDGGPVSCPGKSLLFTKSGSRSRLHRPVYMDFVAVRRFGPDGSLLGEARILGLFTSRVFNNSPRDFPLVGQKIKAILQGSGLEPVSHDGKRLVQILETFPREELFQTPTDELLKTAVGVLHIQERRRLKMFMRKSQYGRFVTCLIYAPREGYTTALRKRFQQVLTEYLDVQDLEFNTLFTESTHARLYIVMRVGNMGEWTFSLKEIEERLVDLARSWTDRLSESLIEYFGEERSSVLYTRYVDAFSYAYREEFSTRTAVADVDHLETLSDQRDLAVSIYRALNEDMDAMRFKIFRSRSAIAFSDVLPMLENLGLRVLGGHPYTVEPKNLDKVWIYDFNVRYSGGHMIELDKVKSNFQEAFDRIWHGNAENDSFNRLTLAVGLNWREVALLRAFAQYFRQIRFPFSQMYIKDALVDHPDIARSFIDLFNTRFNPLIERDDLMEAALVANIKELLEKVASLDQDRILRRYLDVILATLRTNFYQSDSKGNAKDYIAFKVNPHLIPDIPKPLPQFEIFVYSPRVEGVHLRGGKVARGGIRWSDRREDFRTEVLGLVKAQQVKNAVIVPVGAKGGFIPKLMPRTDNRDVIMEEGISCYKTFIRGLLDITDNIVEGKVVPPAQVVRLDEDDPYLVVAADKGTATFSDIANSVAAEYGFWLGDAFASGGSAGYDHKKMGITAKGAWVSVQRHFRELGIDVQTAPITVIGIGDMSGDVFGNGLLRSHSVKLIAAFDHRHIFVDPTPDPTVSFAERARLFTLPRSSWGDYNPTLISEGGGIFPRSAKSITLTLAMQKCFGLTATKMTPMEFMSALLRCPVDLLWNGGIGTYIKSSRETHADVGDKANDGLRVNGCDVQARVIAEGGNLGMTQLGRIEYGLKGGLSNTDFIDNSGGVDCSDHEVNIKILINDVVASGDLTLKHRNQMLVEMTDAVGELVLLNNYRQAQCISLARAESVYRMGEYKRYIHSLVTSGKLDRELEFIPGEEELHDRLVSGKGIVRPELATLLSYTKAILKDQLAHSNLQDDPYIRKEMERAFPDALVKRYPEALLRHKLLPQIVATQVANNIVNYMGITFVHRMVDAAGSPSSDIARAFIAARDVFDLESWWHEIETLDAHVPAEDQLDMMRQLVRLMRRATRWFLRNHRCGMNVEDVVKRFRPGVRDIAAGMPAMLCGSRRQVWEERHANLLQKGVPDALATYIAGVDSMLPALAIIQAAELTKRGVQEAGTVYFAIGNMLDLYWMYEEINGLKIENHWQALAREAYRDDLDWQQRTLTVGVLNANYEGAVDNMLEQWGSHHGDMIARWRRIVSEIRAMDTREFAMYGVALRELMDLAQATLHVDICMIG